MIKNVILPKYIFRGILHNNISFPQRIKMFGADTETVRGEPYTFQVSSDGKYADLVFVNSQNVLDKFLEYIRPRLVQGHVNVMYFHNLKFDLPVLLKNYQKDFIGTTKLQFYHKDIYFDFVVAKLYFGRIKFPENKVLTVIDSYAFFTNIPKASLSGLATQLNLPVQKLGRLRDIGKRRYKAGTPSYRKFVEYSKKDAVVEWHLGSWIVNQYKKYKTRVCVSSPQFSMRVFRHYFMRRGDCIKFPPPNVVRGSILSYHGGKNGFYVNGVTVVKDCSEIDVVSMYPYAMKSMPNFLSGKYVKVKKYIDEYEGIYCISGKINPCKYPILFTHNFKPLRDRCNNIWVTSYELRDALKYNEIKITKIRGFLWQPDGKADHNPFSEFVDFFFKLKTNAPTNAEKILAKLILNSLYGKTIQTIEANEKDKENFKADFILDKKTGIILENKDKNVFLFKAGGMFNPFVATLITGFARTYLHRLEHKYKALHSSTDSIKTMLPIKENNRLGGIKLECRGRCCLFRNKLYLHYNRYTPRDIKKYEKKHADKIKEKKDRNGKLHEAYEKYLQLKKGKTVEVLEKYALHGFAGKTDTLIEMFAEKKNEYKSEHLFKVREAIRQKKIPLDFAVSERILHGVDFNKVTYI